MQSNNNNNNNNNNSNIKKRKHNETNDVDDNDDEKEESEQQHQQYTLSFIKQYKICFAPKYKGFFDIIVVDPPWKYRPGATTVGDATKKYDTMTIEDIKRIPFGNLASENSMILMWTTSAFLGASIDIIKEWGFDYKTVMFVWVKVFPNSKTLVAGPGWYTRPSCEYVMLGVRGSIQQYKQSGAVKQVFLEPRPGNIHSRKPMQTICNRLKEFLGNENYRKLNKIELFARSGYPGWHTWGNEATKYDKDNDKNNDNINEDVNDNINENVKSVAEVCLSETKMKIK